MNKQITPTENANKCLAEYNAGRSSAYYGRTFNPGPDANSSIKSDFNSSDYFFYRQGESVPEDAKASMNLCNLAYRRVGVCYNTICVMSEFVSSGIKLVHKNKRMEKFYEAWADHIGLDDMAERFSNYLFRLGTVFPYRVYGKIPIVKEKEWSKVSSSEKSKADLPTIEKRRIPVAYTFLNPMSIDVVGGQYSTFNLEPRYILKFNKMNTTTVNQLFLRDENREVVDKNNIPEIPTDIMAALKTKKRFIELNPENFSVYAYKKDSWDQWAFPMLHSILSDLIHLDKLNLADKCALDGSISNIRLWRLGVLTDNPQTTILPQPAAINKLRNILANNVGGGTIDLVWGPELDFKESNTQVHNFLGSEKYKHVMTCIYSGLGIPPVLSGQDSGGFNNNYISMRILIERLKYGRRVLKDFLTKELKIVNKAMKFGAMPKIQFGNMNIGDEATEKQLLIDLMDRDVISSETVLDRFDFFDDVERAKIKRSVRTRGTTMPEKAGPYHNPQTEHELKKIILQAGGVAPSEVGVDLLPRKPGEKTKMEQMAKMVKQSPKPSGKEFAPKNPNGRPKNSTDSKPRKQRKDKVRTKASQFVTDFVWANDALKKIGDIIYPALCAILKHKNLREFSVAEFNDYELNKFAVLSKCIANSEITTESVYSILDTSPKVSDEIMKSYAKLMDKFTKLNNRKPTVDEDRQIKASAYSLNTGV